MDSEAFLRRHFQDLQEGEVFLLRFKRESDQRVVQKTFTNKDEDFETAAKMAANASKQGTNVYYGVNPYSLQSLLYEKKGRDAISRITHAYVDVDDVGNYANTSPLHQKLNSLPPYETMVATGGGIQILWRYGHAIENSEFFELAQRTNREIALVLGGDTHATDPARTFRLPGTRNWKPKYPEDTYAGVINHHSERVDIEYLIDILPREPAPEVTSSPRTHDIDPTEFYSALDAIDPHSLSYDEWLRVLMAVHAFDSGPEGLAEAERWGHGQHNEIRTKWKSFRREGSSPSTVFYFANAAGWKPPKKEGPSGTFEYGSSDPESKHKTQTGIFLSPMSDFLAENDAGPEWVIDDLLNRGGTSLLVAKQKVGKSTFAANIAVAVAAGLPFLGHKTHQGTVHIYSLEVHRAFIREQYRKLIAAYGLTSAPDIMIHASTRIFDNALETIADIIMEQKPCLVILDPLAKVLDKLVDSNSYLEVYRAMRPVIQLAEESNTHILCIHHSNKGMSEGTDSVMGSVGFAASVDLTMMLRRDREANIRTLDIEARLLPESDTIAFDFDDNRMVEELGSRDTVIKLGAEQRLLAHIGANPGISMAELKLSSGIPHDMLGPLIFRLVNAFKIQQDSKTKRFTLSSYTPPPPPPTPVKGSFIV